MKIMGMLSNKSIGAVENSVSFPYRDFQSKLLVHLSIGSEPHILILESKKWEAGTVFQESGTNLCFPSILSASLN